jgi:hypothetical protein
MHFLAILDCGRLCGLTSEMDGRTSNTVGDCGVRMVPWLTSRTNGVRGLFGDPQVRVIRLKRR